jgi:membrane-associated protein
LWGAGITTLGYFLGTIDVVKNNIEIAIVAIIAVSLLPVAIELLRHRREARRGEVSTS